MTQLTQMTQMTQMTFIHFKRQSLKMTTGNCVICVICVNFAVGADLCVYPVNDNKYNRKKGEHTGSPLQG